MALCCQGMDQPTTPASPKGLGLAVAAAQLALALSWTVYVVFLPALAAQAGLPPRAVLWLLVVDQAVFVLADYACWRRRDHPPFSWP